MPEIERKKVLFLIPTLTLGGAERVVVTLLKHLDRNKYQLNLAVIDSRRAVFLNQLPEDVNFIDLDCTRVRYALPKIVELIWRTRPHVVFSTLGHLNLLLAMMRPAFPNDIKFIARETLVVSHVLHRYRHPKLMAVFYKKFYKNHDIIVCQSHDMRDDLLLNFSLPSKKTVVINNPVDTRRIGELIKQCHETEISISSSKINLIAVGRLTSQKGFDILIEAIAMVNLQDICLYLLGEGPLQHELEQLAFAKGVSNQVKFVKFQSNPYCWMAKADAYILSSRFEGFPNVVIEALACGTPVIATPAPGGVHEILDCIPECVVATEVSARSLANALINWFSGPRSRIALSNVARFSIEKIVKQYQSII